MKTDETCVGECVPERFAEYCEAYFKTSGMCKSGSKCCVARDNYGDKLPADLHIPNGHKNQTLPSKPTKPVLLSTKNSHMQHSKQPIKMGSTRPPRPQVPLRESVEGNQIGSRVCDGDCVSGWVALFCEEVDSDAYCPNDLSCCKSESANVQVTTPKPVRFHFFTLIYNFSENNFLYR